MMPYMYTYIILVASADQQGTVMFYTTKSKPAMRMVTEKNKYENKMFGVGQNIYQKMYIINVVISPSLVNIDEYCIH